MSQVMLSKPKLEPQASLGTVIPFECAVCKRDTDDGTAIIMCHSRLRVMLCGLHAS